MATALFAQPLLGPKAQFFDGNGNPLAAGQLEIYQAGTSTPETSYPTYDDAIAGTNANANPVILDSAGRADVWIQAGRSYKFVLKTSVASGGTTVWTVDDYNPAGGYSTPDDDMWRKESNAITFNSTVLFNVVGINLTSRYLAGRRIKLTQTSGTVWGTVASSSFATDTIVRVVLDGGAVLDNGLSAVWYSKSTPVTQGSDPPSIGDRSTYVHAFLNVNQAITTGGFRKINFDTETSDYLNEWDPSANSRFTPAYQSNSSYNQRWRIFAQVTLDTSIVSAQIAIALNGVNVAVQQENSGIAGGTLTIDMIVAAPASVGNFWEIYVNPSANVTIRAGATATFIQIVRVP
jgi:hypothetical protein